MVQYWSRHIHAWRRLSPIDSSLARMLLTLLFVMLLPTTSSIAATVTGVSSSTPNGAYKAGDQIAIVVSFSEAVAVSGSPRVTLETGASDAIVSYTSGSGTQHLTFSYAVAAGHTSSSLDYQSQTSLTLNGGTIRRVSDAVDADLRLPAPGAAGSLSSNTDLVVDTTAPTASVTLLTPSITNAMPISFQIAFSESVTGFTSSDLTVTNGAVSAFSGSGSLYTAEVVASANGAVTIRVPAGAAFDVANNGNTASSLVTVQYDTQPPTITNVTSSPASGAYRATQVINVILTFPEAVVITGGVPSIRLVTGASSGSATYSSGSGTSQLTFRYTISSGDSSEDLEYESVNALVLNGSTISDRAGNAAVLTLPAPGGTGSLSANSAVIIDTTPPTAEISSTLSGDTSLDVIPVTVVFSEAVSGFALSDLSVSNGCASNLRGSGTTYYVDIVPRNNGLVTVAVPANVAVDRAGNGNYAAPTSVNINFSTNAPRVTSVTSSTPDGAYRASQSVVINVSFSEPVAVSGTPQLRLATGSVATVDYVSGSGTDTLSFLYTIASGQNSSDLDYIPLPPLGLNGGQILDAATQSLNAALTFACPGSAGSLSSSKNIIIDTIAPSIPRVSSTTANGSYKAGVTLNVQTEFSETVYVTGVPLLTLETGVNDAVISLVSGSGSNRLNFSYTIQPGHNSNRLDYQSPSAFDTNGGVIQDLAGNIAVVTLPATGSTNSLFGQKQLVVDTTPPTVPNVTSGSADGSYKAGTAINVRLNLSEVVYVSGSPRINLATGQPSRYALFASGSGSTTLNFTYTVAAGDTTNDLDYAGTSALEMNGGAIRDLAGNDAIPNLAVPGEQFSLSYNKNIRLDTTPPTVASVSSTLANGVYRAGTVVPIQVSFSESVNVTGTPYVLLNTTPTQGIATYSTGSGSSALTFLYTVGIGENTGDLDFATSAALIVPGGSLINDAALNNAVTTLVAPGSVGSLGYSSDITIDTLAPTVLEVTSTTDDGFYRAGSTIDISVVLSEPVVLTGTASLLLASGPAPHAATCASVVSGTVLRCSYTVQSGDEAGDLDYVSTTSLAMNGSGSSLVDLGGNAVSLTLAVPGTLGSLGYGKEIGLDTGAPTVNLTSSAASHTRASPIPVQVKFSESVSGLTASAFTVTNGTIQNLSGSGSSYNAELVPALNGLVSVTLVAGSVLDSAGNTNVVSNTVTRTYDSVRPIVSLTSTLPARSNAAMIPVEVIFSEPVTGLVVSDLSLTNGSVVTLTGSGTTYSASILPTVDGEVSVAIPEDVAQDSAGNGNLSSASLVLVVDRTPAEIVSVTSTSMDGYYRVGDRVAIEVGLSEPVTVSGALRLALQTGREGAYASYISGSGSNVLVFEYVVVDGDNSVDLDYRNTNSLLFEGDSLADFAQNPLALELPPPGSAQSLAGQKNLVIDTLPPINPIITSPESGRVFSTRRVVVSGSTEGSAAVRLVDSHSGSLCETVADTGGTWSCVLENLKDGRYVVQATAEDQARNTSASPEVSFIIDTVLPAPPVFTLPTKGATIEATPRFGGTAPPGMRVRVRLNGSDLCTAIVDDGGNWNCVSTVQLALGRYTVQGLTEDPDDLAQSLPTTLALTVGVRITGVVVMANRTRDPLPGVVISDGLDSAESAADGMYSLIVTDSEASNVTASKPGWRISKANDSVSQSSAMGAATTWLAMPALDPESYTVWNGAIPGFKPSLRVLNRSGSSRVVTATIYREDGSECPDTVAMTAPPLDYVTLPLHANACLQGGAKARLIRINYGSREYDADLVVQQGQATDRNLASLFSLPLDNGVSGKSFVFVDNAYHRTRGGERTFVMRNELVLSNLSSTEKRFTVRRYQSNTNVVKAESVVIPGNGSAVVEFPTQGEEAQENGVQEIDPEDPSATYVAVLIRRGEQQLEPNRVTDTFLFMDYSRKGAQKNQFARVQYLSKKYAVQYAEIANVASVDVNVEISRLVALGRALPPIVLHLRPYETRKIRLSRLLGASRESVAHISSDVADSIIVNSVIKHYQGDRDLLSMKTLAIRETFGDTQYGMYRRPGRSKTLLKLTNVGASEVEGSVACYSQSQLLDSRAYILKPGAHEEFRLRTCFGRSASGVIEVNSSQPGAIVADAMLYRRRGGIQVPGRLR